MKAVLGLFSILFVAAMVALACMATPLLIWAVWNLVAVPVFGIKTITFFWQAILVGMLVNFVTYSYHKTK